MKRFLFLCLFPIIGKAQFAPAAGQPGSTAIKKDSNIIVNWANMCKVTRGLQDISNLGSGYATYGDSSAAIGPADGSTVVSLGDGGNAILTFPQKIKNGSGFDFCVFENSFNAGFLELAFVEVSSDGINFTRFPAVSNTQNTVQIGPFDTNNDPTRINNLAGKYVANYGVPFDLQELSGTAGLDIDNITHVKIIDVVGCIQPAYARYDMNNNIINELWATPFPSSGFDLDAVGVMHQQPVGLKENSNELNVRLFYSDSELTIYFDQEEKMEVSIIDISGKVVLERSIDKGWNRVGMANFSEGIYIVKIKGEKRQQVKKIVH
jgi:hypothetical protein